MEAPVLTSQGFLTRTRPSFPQPLLASQDARIVRSPREFFDALALGLAGKLPEIVITKPLPIEEQIKIQDLKAPLRIRCVGHGGLYDAGGYDGFLFKCFDTTNDGQTYRRTPVLQLVDCYLRSTGGFFEGQSADSVHIQGGYARRNTGGSVVFASGTFGDLRVQDAYAAFLTLNIESNRLMVTNSDIGALTADTSSSQALWTINGNRAENITLESTGSGQHATVAGNVSGSPRSLTVTAFNGSYTETGNENYTVVP